MSRHLFPESTFVSRPCLSCCRWSSRGGCARPPTALSGMVYRGCPCHPPVCHRVQGDSVAKRQPLCVLVGVVTSCVLCARVRGHVPRPCATENTYILWALSSSFHFMDISDASFSKCFYSLSQFFREVWPALFEILHTHNLRNPFPNDWNELVFEIHEFKC